MRTLITFVVAFIVVLFVSALIFNRGVDPLGFAMIALLAAGITALDYRKRSRSRVRAL